MGWTSPEAKDTFQRIAKHEAERRDRDRRKVSEALQTVPASHDTLTALSGLSPDDAERALCTHPGYLGNRKIESLRTMLELFRCALADLAATITNFPELFGPDGRTMRKDLENQIAVRVNKELFAALGAAKALVDYSRRIIDLVDANVFETRLKETFNPGEHSLIVKLRDSLHHAVHSRANWQRRWSAGINTIHFVIEREELLTEGDLNRAAREYLDHLGPTCDITELLRGYAQKVELFYSWLLPEVESHLPLEISDYRACRKAIKRQQARSSYELMIGLWTQAGADPYQHLSKHLTAKQMKELEVFPHRSRQQVDYVIACLDKDEICDDHLREVVYKFFDVGVSQKNRKAKEDHRTLLALRNPSPSAQNLGDPR